MDRNELIEIRSEEVQDIISRSPSWMLQWGILLMFFVFAALLGASWFIKYPDVITASVVVTTDPSPVFIVSRTPGKLTLLKKENEQVRQGDMIGYIQSNTTPDNILELERMTNQYRLDSDLRKLLADLSQLTNAGDLQNPVNNTQRAVESLLTFESTQLYEKQQAYLESQIASNKKLNANLIAQFEIQKQEGAITAQNFSGDSLLYARNLIPNIEFNQSRSALLQQQRSLKGTESSIISNELQIETLQRQLMELEVDRDKQASDLTANVSYSISELQGAIASWKENYLFISPVDGELAYMTFLENDQFTEARPLFAVLPASGSLVAQGELPVDGAGKVMKGQSVKIKLNNYPEQQFGTISGLVQNIAPLPSEETYRLMITLPEGLKSSYQRELAFQPQMSGETEIITEDLRLLERFFYQFRSLVQ